MTKSVAAAPHLNTSRTEEKENFLTAETNNARLYRSALSLNNVDKSRNTKGFGRRDDKFMRGSTTSLINTSREIPIILTPEKIETDESPTRPPRKVKTEKEVSKKDLFFDIGGTSTSKLRTSTSYSELARTSMLNSNYFKGHKSPTPAGEVSKLSSEDWKQRSYYFGETLNGDSSENKTTHFPTDTSSHYVETAGNKGDRSPRTTDRRGSPESNTESYLRVQSEPPHVKGNVPQPIREEIFLETPKVRRLYPTVERKNSRQNRIVHRSESKREPKR